jgi:protein-tyrosine phosphatase
MDTGHLQQLRKLARGPQDIAKLRLLRSYDPAAGTRLDVPDPYYGNDADFEHVLELCEAAMPRLIRDIRAALAEQPEDEADELLDEDAEIEVDGGSLRR